MARFRDEGVRMALNICAARAGYSLRPLQEQVISFVQGSDVFVGLPMGSGKSLCYNILPDVFNSLRKVKSSIAVIVSPTDERPGTGMPHFMRFMFRNARMQLIAAKFHCTFQAISKTWRVWPL